MYYRKLSAGAARLLGQHQARLWLRRNLSDHHGPPDNYKHLIRPNMDRGYPIPTQLYSDAYAARQSKNNAMLAVSGLALLSSIAYVWVSDTFGFLAPPPRQVNIPLDQLK